MRRYGRTFGARGGRANRRLCARPAVVDVGGSFLVGTVRLLQRREPMPLIEVPRSDVALESPQIEAVGVEFLCEVDEPRPQTSPGPFRVHVEVGEPTVVEDQECHETPVDFDHPECLAGQDDRSEVLANLIVAVDRGWDRRDRGVA
jgi:hypothetical protein